MLLACGGCTGRTTWMVSPCRPVTWNCCPPGPICCTRPISSLLCAWAAGAVPTATTQPARATTTLLPNSDRFIFISPFHRQALGSAWQPILRNPPFTQLLLFRIMLVYDTGVGTAAIVSLDELRPARRRVEAGRPL